MTEEERRKMVQEHRAKQQQEVRDRRDAGITLARRERRECAHEKWSRLFPAGEAPARAVEIASNQGVQEALADAQHVPMRLSFEARRFLDGASTPAAETAQPVRQEPAVERVVDTYSRGVLEAELAVVRPEKRGLGWELRRKGLSAATVAAMGLSEAA